ncbi:DUF4279 domain-containing protein [bacterium]|nr:DUF4279 domain-containing protein [bacterium]
MGQHEYEVQVSFPSNLSASVLPEWRLSDTLRNVSDRTNGEVPGTGILKHLSGALLEVSELSEERGDRSALLARTALIQGPSGLGALVDLVRAMLDSPGVLVELVEIGDSRVYDAANFKALLMNIESSFTARRRSWLASCKPDVEFLLPAGAIPLMKEKVRCPCCESLTISPPGDGGEICSECGWKDDPEQRKDPMLRNRANELSLKEARHKYFYEDAGIEAPESLLPEIKAGLSFHERNLNPDEITRDLGIEPTNVWRPRPDSRLPKDLDGVSWCLETRYIRTYYVEEVIEDLRRRISVDAQAIRSLADRLGATVGLQICINIHHESRLPAPSFETETIRFLADCGAWLDIDTQWYV